MGVPTDRIMIHTWPGVIWTDFFGLSKSHDKRLFLDEMADGPHDLYDEAMPLPVSIVIMTVGAMLVWMAIPSVICALLFRGDC